MEHTAKHKKCNNKPPGNLSISFEPILVTEAKFKIIPMGVVPA